ncbi:MAG: hypothetical protein J7L23_01890 [Candidatus Diapherotrites archaeon]|nr:hypothetical protein [Candidatus Diapherotrites archaeon]
MISIQNILLAVFSLIGSAGFAIGLFYSLKNNKITKFASSLWFVFCIGMIIAFFWSITASLVYFGIHSDVFFALDNILLACFASFLLASVYISYMGDVKLM